jgi:hypothetical protein
MAYEVSCAVCDFECEEVESVEEVFELQERHTNRRGSNHRLEFERIE